MGTAAEPNFLDMSDEDLSKFNPESLPEATTEEEPQEEEVLEDDSSEDAAVTPEAQGEAEGEEGEGEDEAEDKEEEAPSEETSEGDKTPDTAVKADEAKKDDEAKKPEETTEAIDYKAEYERLTAPFKANGRELAVKNVDDAISLMQMGANYNKKMAAMKPQIKLLKMLENNGLLSEEKISFLIDLEKRDPNAINKLVKDSGIDPLDFDAEKAGAYQPKTYTVDDREIELDTVLDDIQSSSGYTQTLDIVSTKWDKASKEVIAATPQLLKVINAHVESGIYDIIAKEVESERTLGRLNGLSDIQAYRQIGDAIQERGGFAHLAPQASRTPTKTVVQPKPKKEDEAKLKEKRRAASSTKPTTSQTVPKDFNPLAMSDEEFAKVGVSKFL